MKKLILRAVLSAAVGAATAAHATPADYLPSTTLSYASFTAPAVSCTEMLDGPMIEQVFPALIAAGSDGLDTADDDYSQVKRFLAKSCAISAANPLTSEFAIGVLGVSFDELTNMLGPDELPIIGVFDQSTPDQIASWLKTVLPTDVKSIGDGILKVQMYDVDDDQLEQLLATVGPIPLETKGGELGTFYLMAKGAATLMSPNVKNLRALKNLQQPLSATPGFRKASSLLQNQKTTFFMYSDIRNALKMYGPKVCNAQMESMHANSAGMTSEEKAALTRMSAGFVESCNRNLEHYKNFRFFALAAENTSSSTTTLQAAVEASPKLIAEIGADKPVSMEYSMYRPSEAAIYYWTSGLTEDFLDYSLSFLPAEELNEANAAVQQQLGMSFQKLLKTFGPQFDAVVDWNNVSKSAMYPIPTVRASIQLRDRRAAQQIIERVINLFIEESGEEGTPEVSVVGDRIDMTWPVTQQVGVSTVVTLDTNSLNFAVSTLPITSATPTVASAAPSYGVREYLLMTPPQMVQVANKFQGLALAAAGQQEQSAMRALQAILAYAASFKKIQSEVRLDGTTFRSTTTVDRDFSVQHQKPSEAVILK